MKRKDKRTPREIARANKSARREFEASHNAKD